MESRRAGVSFSVRRGEIVTLSAPTARQDLHPPRHLGPHSLRRQCPFAAATFAACPRTASLDSAWRTSRRTRHLRQLTVRENLRIATWQRRDRQATERPRPDSGTRDLPRLGERLDQVSGTLSGGEQQMLAVGRALMSRAGLLLLDEPSMGLAPRLVREIFGVIEDINRTGTTVLLVEQNANMALHIASRACVLETGRVILSGSAKELLDDARVKDAYLGHSLPSKVLRAAAGRPMLNFVGGELERRGIEPR